MSTAFKRTIALLIPLGVVCAVLIPVVFRVEEPPRLKIPEIPREEVSPALSVLGEAPDWKRLDAYQGTITRADFERLLTTVFVGGGAWRDFIELDDEGARIRTGEDGDEIGMYHLKFAAAGDENAPPRMWRATKELPPAPPGKPLDGIRIAIDPGHIGGDWASLEERWLVIGEGQPVCEGDMTLLVGKLLKPRLEALGATVLMVRKDNKPITPLRPDSLMEPAAESVAPEELSPVALRKLAERLFYRTAEIRARAERVNRTLKPDLVLCLHFNADAWGNPTAPTLVERSHMHLLLNGAYTDEEVALADQRFAMLSKLLGRTHEEEAFVGATVADVFAEKSGLPPFIYPEGASNVRQVNGHPYLWARNLLANRLYDCPVIFMEPYVMNSTSDYPRMKAGDYEGLKNIGGKEQPSIFREYADALAEGLANHYSAFRATTP